MRHSTSLKRRTGLLLVPLVCCWTSVQAEMLPLSAAISGGAEFSYVSLRCSGLYVSILSLSLPGGLEAMRPTLTARLNDVYEMSISEHIATTGATIDVARGKVKRDIAVFSNEYADIWNENYVATGNYLNERFDEDASTCGRIFER